ncbi:putative spermidine/putrescine transport system permease protein [Deinococcus metalli]|uniref:Putative spermidine/putrescine transport system permease protein n=1 Tax=Deinococcus metalli TaxID=1141878 RepID=A0A7W8NS61_9DEIO|nr:ABC transporter permease subunit [Deinococcus metalli]MBB5376822.1 putative spermidine/putrescine transport system permease protein [Deinococcus metalli]GHF45611.1 spermidine/putrescine ABC transporter permease [Deinococcus metalli]
MTRRPGLGIGGGIVIVLFALYFFAPLVSLAVASMWQGGNRYDLSAYGGVVREENFIASFKLSLMLAVETIALTLAVVFPAVFWVNLRAQHLRAFFNVLSVIAFIVPPIVLVSGISGLYRGPEWFVGTPHFLVVGYTVLAIPYTYRTLDNGMRALNLQTLSEAAQSCGAGWGTLIRRIILPNVRGAVLGAVLLILTLALGEFTFANVLLYQTLPVYMSYIASTRANESSALAIMALLFTWLAMYILLNVESRAARKA